MALKVKKKGGFWVADTGIATDEAYFVLRVIHDFDGRTRTQALGFASKEHYEKTFSSLFGGAGRGASYIRPKEAVAVAKEPKDMREAHALWKKAFEDGGYEVIIVDFE